MEEQELPTIEFKETKENAVIKSENKAQISPIEQHNDKTSGLVSAAFNQAVKHIVENDASVQDKLLDGAAQTVENKVEAIKSQAESESKAANFNNKKGACECFGYNETTTEKWAVNTMNVWHNAMTGLWIVIGAFTFAPVTFVAKKIKVIFKASWVAILLAVLIYLGVLTSPLWAGRFAELLQRIKG